MEAKYKDSNLTECLNNRKNFKSKYLLKIYSFFISQKDK